MINQPLISCIIPTYNSEQYLSKAIESIFAQTYRPIEVIMVDGGSTDRTIQIASRYNRVKVVCQEGAGPADARNTGIKTTQGSFLAFLDSDDFWHREKLSRQIAQFQLHPNLDICITYVQVFYENGLKDKRKYIKNHPRLKPIPGFASTTLLVRREVFNQVGLFNSDYRFADATNWFLSARESGLHIEVLPEVLVYHRLHRDNLTIRHRDASCSEFLEMVKTALRRKQNQKR